MSYRKFAYWLFLALFVVPLIGCHPKTKITPGDNVQVDTTSSRTNKNAEVAKSWFIMTVEVDKEQLSIPLDIERVERSTIPNLFSVDCNADGKWDHIDASDDVTCQYKKAGKYTIRINGHMDHLKLLCATPKGDSKQEKVRRFDLLSIDQWGKNQWQSMEKFTLYCDKMHISSVDNPVLSQCRHMAKMFYGAASMNESLQGWDVSNITNMREMFAGARSFDQPLEKWDVSKVTDMSGMFQEATSFNQPLAKWDVSNVIDMRRMFHTASTFNQPLDTWDLSNVVDMLEMFDGAKSFNQSLKNWQLNEDSSGVYYQ